MSKYCLLIFMILTTVISCTQGKNKVAKSQQELTEKTNTGNEISIGSDKWFIQKNQNSEKGRFLLNIKSLNDSILFFRFLYFESNDNTISMLNEYNRDSNFVCYYNTKSKDVLGLFSEDDNVNNSKNSLSFLKIDNDIKVSLKSNIFQSKILNGEIFAPYSFPNEVEKIGNGQLFYVDPGTRYFFRLKKSVEKNESIETIKCFTGCSVFESQVNIPKNILRKVSEVVTDGYGYYYETNGKDTTKFKIIGYGEVNEDKYGRQYYQYQYWIKASDFFQFFEKF